MEMMAPNDGKEPNDKTKGYDKYELENACDTLLKAEMIKQDSKMMEALKPYLEEKAKAAAQLTKITSIDGLKKKSKEMGY